MLTLFGMAMIVAALAAVYVTADRSRRGSASSLASRLASGNALALGATIMLAMGAGAIAQAAMMGSTLTALVVSCAALVAPFAGFVALLKVRPLPEPPAGLVPANSPLPPSVRQAA